MDLQRQIWQREQLELKKRLIARDDVKWSLGPLQENGTDSEGQQSEGEALVLVGGVDISFADEPPLTSTVEEAGDAATDSGSSAPGQQGVAALVVLSFPDLTQVVYEDYEPLSMDVPYLPGFLAFREVPAYARLLERAALTPWFPQVVLVDGSGTLHPQGFGSACHLGVIAGVPTIGVAKNLLVAEPGLDKATIMDLLAAPVPLESPPPPPPSPALAPLDSGAQEDGVGGDGKGLISPSPLNRVLYDRGGAAVGRCVPVLAPLSGQALGVAVVPVKGAKNPIYVSVGHRLSLETSLVLVLRCCRRVTLGGRALDPRCPPSSDTGDA